MGRRILNISAAGILALSTLMGFGDARAEGMLVKFTRGVLCDKIAQVEEIVAQYGQSPVRDVLASLNKRTGKLSCGVVTSPVLLLMEPLRVISTSSAKIAIVKLTDVKGNIQYSWRAMGKSKPDEVAV